MEPVKIKLQNHYRGDSWTGMLIGPILINDLTPVNALASCKMQFRDADAILGQEFNTTGGVDIGDITITDSINWEISVPVQDLALTAGTWYWDLECTDIAGSVLTLYKGTIKIIEDITK